MPEYERLDGANSGCGASWRAFTSLEKKLTILSVVLGVVIFVLALALSMHSCKGPTPITTLSPTPSTLSTKESSTTSPTEISTLSTKKSSTLKPTEISTLSTKESSTLKPTEISTLTTKESSTLSPTKSSPKSSVGPTTAKYSVKSVIDNDVPPNIEGVPILE